MITLEEPVHAVASNVRPDAAPSRPNAPLSQLRSWLRARGFGPAEIGILALINVALVAFLIAAYLLDRVHDPALHAWGQRLLSRPRGLLMTAVLLVGGLALLGGVWLARMRSTRGVVIATSIAILSAGVFVAVGVVDYDSKASRRLVPGQRFKPNERFVARRFGVRLPPDWKAQTAEPAAATASAASAKPKAHEISTAHGRTIFLQVCATCHGPRGEGVVGSGKSLHDNAFINARDDAALVEFLKVGRQPWEPDNTTKVQMPPRGGDPRLKDDDLRDVAAYVRELSGGKKPDASKSAAAAPGQAPTAAAEEPPLFVAHRSFLPDAPEGPGGLAAAYFASFLRPIWAIPVNAASYFRTFFLLSGVATLYVVLAALGAVVVLLVCIRRRSAEPALPSLLLATTGWWWATACWTIVFGLVYLLR